MALRLTASSTELKLMKLKKGKGLVGNIEGQPEQCEDCLGTGYVEVANGPDDFDRVKCECQISKEADEQMDNLRDSI